jgi:PAS domain S-box-containing protein
MDRLMNIMQGLLTIPTTDPDDTRRRRLLNILLAALVILMLTGSIMVPLASFIGLAPPVPKVFYYGLSVMLLGTSLIYLINRYWSGKIAAWIFLIILVISMLTTPSEQALSVHNVLAFAIPIVIASFLLFPTASYLMAVLVSLGIAVIGFREPSIGVQVSPMLTLFLIALISWIAAHNLENALRGLRALNRELDQRVIERTQELAEALEREHAEASKNQAILEGIADGVIVLDTNGKAVVANPAITSLLGISANEVAGHNIEALMNEKVDLDDQEIITGFLQDNELAHSGLKIQWGQRTLSVSMAPVRDTTDHVTGTVAVFRDFTREAEIDRMKSTFVSIASHELRTPLNAIMGYAELLHERVYGPLTDKQQGATKRILANTNYMLSLASNLLDRAQIEAGTLELNIAPFSPADVVNKAIEAMDILAQHKSLQLTGDIAAEMPAEVTGDQQRVNQILVNLIGNALKFTNEGGVHIRTYCPDADHWAIDVSDTGIGVPQEAQQYIFEPFRRANESPTREYRGAGLGLSIVKQLVTMMGGDIRLDSRVGQGSTFTIVLPL